MMYGIAAFFTVHHPHAHLRICFIESELESILAFAESVAFCAGWTELTLANVCLSETPKEKLAMLRWPVR